MVSCEGVMRARVHECGWSCLSHLLRVGHTCVCSFEDSQQRLGMSEIDLLLIHDLDHMHFTEPADTGVLVNVANGVIEALSREIQWLHLPVPITRSDVAYFEPMRNLNLDAKTELYLGVVHMTDGVAGAQERIAAAKEVVPNFGIATECGFGRRSPDSVSDLMNLHAQLAEPLKASVNK